MADMGSTARLLGKYTELVELPEVDDGRDQSHFIWELRRPFSDEEVIQRKKKLRDRVSRNPYLFRMLQKFLDCIDVDELAHSQHENLDAAAEFLWRINYEEWTPEDRKMVSHIMYGPSNSSKTNVFLLDRPLCSELIQHLFDDGQETSTFDSSKRSLLVHDYISAETHFGAWLRECEIYFLHTKTTGFLRLVRRNSESHEFPGQLPVSILTTLLANVTRFILQRHTYASQPHYLWEKTTITSLIAECLETAKFPQLEREIPPDFAAVIRKAYFDKTYLMECAQVLATGLEKLSGACNPILRNGVKRSILWNNGDHLPHLPPITEISRTDMFTGVSIKELEASFITSGWFKFATTVWIDEHLTFDRNTETILVYWDNKIDLFDEAGFYNGNRLAM